MQRSNNLDPRSPLPAVDLHSSLRYAIRRLATFIPSGGSLPAESWRRRHRGIVLLLWAYVLVVPWIGVAAGRPWRRRSFSSARTLRLQTIAEGIEQAELQDSLLGMGCEIGQGFLFSPPLELSLVRERLMAEGSTGLLVVSSA